MRYIKSYPNDEAIQGALDNGSLATSNLNSQEDWVYHVPQTGTFVKSPDATGWRVSGYNGIPSGWTVIDAQ